MKNLSSPLAKLVALAACALTLGSCSRAEYAMLPKSASYHGVARVATPAPATVAPSETTVNEPVAVDQAAANQVAAPIATSASQPAPALAATKAAPAPATSTSVGSTTTAATPAPKLNVVQRLALNKVTRKVDKLMQKASARQHDNTASTARGIDGNLRIGLILLLIGLLLGLINGLVGTIVAIIGLVFIVLWLLDQA